MNLDSLISNTLFCSSVFLTSIIGLLLYYLVRNFLSSRDQTEEEKAKRFSIRGELIPNMDDGKDDDLASKRRIKSDELDLGVYFTESELKSASESFISRHRHKGDYDVVRLITVGTRINTSILGVRDDRQQWDYTTTMEKILQENRETYHVLPHGQGISVRINY